MVKTYQLESVSGDILKTGSITDMYHALQAGSRPMTGAEKKDCKIKPPYDGWITPSKTVLKIKEIQ